MNYDLGSEWQKWDLHIHTPLTKLNDGYFIGDGDIWETYCRELENSDVQVFGITDYFCCENYFIFVEKHKLYYPNSEKVFFPNIEFRLEVSVNRKAEEVNIHVIFSNHVPKAKLDTFLSKLNTNLTKNDAIVTCKELTNEQFVSAAINHNHLKEILKQVFGSDVCYVIIAACNNAGLRADSTSPRKLALTDELDKICDGFFGGTQNVDYYLKTDRYETGEPSIPKPVIAGSDCHSFDDIDKFLGKRHVINGQQNGQVIIEKDITWIKGEKTFEGLRQIFHEPQYRKDISDITPRQPIRKIEKIKFDFPQNTQIKNKNSSEFQDLCIRNLRKEIPLSPHFTCFIGGRGTGKSTIINTIAERLGIKTDFFNSNHNTLYFDEKIKCELGSTHSNFVEIEGTNDIEFVSQGKVEKLTEGRSLTKLIFEERILQPNNNLQGLKFELESQIERIKDQIKLIFDLKKIQAELIDRKKEKLTHESIVNSVGDPLYTEITEEIKTLSKTITQLDSNESKYNTIVEKLRILIEEIQFQESPSDEYEQRLREIKLHLLSLQEFDEVDRKVIINKVVFDDTQNRREGLKRQLVKEQDNLKKIFEQKGTSEESIKDSQNANESLARVLNSINLLREKAESTKNKLKVNFQLVKEIVELKLQSESIIRSKVDDLSNKLDRKNENVSSISYLYKFNKAALINALFDDFKQTFSSYHIPNTSWEDVRLLLFEIDANDSLLDLPYCKFVRKLDDIIETKSYDRSRNYVTVVRNIFCEVLNYRVYQYLIYKHFFNVFEYVEIEGFYGQKELKCCSFGQKCTAVIVTLLMTGVKPLIIDEPEAHLDNKLIADYLVDLIKEKKADRQIIFATHNANFVINGDAELIYILEVPDDDNCTAITATTIENKKYREKLLKLEGGREAFEKREKRLLKNISPLN